MSLTELLQQKRELKATQTRVTNRKGEVFIESKEGTLQFVGQTANPEYFNQNGKTTFTPSWFSNGNWSKGQVTRPNPEIRQNIENLSFVTYNVWFAEQDREKRAQALIELLQRNPSDIICFQEVTNEFLKLILAHEFFRENYYCSDSSGYASITPYGVVMFVKLDLPIREFVLHPLPSNMGRRFLIAHFDLPNEKILLVCTAHLESMDNAEMRHEQLVNSVYPKLKYSESSQRATDYAVFLGDSNFCTFTNEFQNNVIKPGYLKDLWSTLHPEASNRESHTMVEESIVIDRVLYSPETISPLEISRIGVNPIYYRGENRGLPSETPNPDAVHPSDHVGLFAILNLSK
jgi:tyrosyl-DNA phosphodiesterase 2